MRKNRFIKCDVRNCKHNLNGCNCSLDKVSITCGCGESCTRCNDYSDQE